MASPADLSIGVIASPSDSIMSPTSRKLRNKRSTLFREALAKKGVPEMGSPPGARSLPGEAEAKDASRSEAVAKMLGRSPESSPPGASARGLEGKGAKS